MCLGGWTPKCFSRSTSSREHLHSGFSVQLRCFLVPAASQHILYLIPAWPVTLIALRSFGLFKRVRFEDETHFPRIFACMQEYRSLSNATWPCSWLLWKGILNRLDDFCGLFLPELSYNPKNVWSALHMFCTSFSSSPCPHCVVSPCCFFCIQLPSAAHRAPAWPSAVLDCAHLALYESLCSPFPSTGTVVLWKFCLSFWVALHKAFLHSPTL